MPWFLAPRWRSRARFHAGGYRAADGQGSPPVSTITLLTDFGTTDSYVAEVKGGLLSRGAGRDAGGRHPFGTAGRRARRRVPAGSRLASLSPGARFISRWWTPASAPSRAALALAAHGHYFVGPDNGLFSFVLRDAEVQIVSLAYAGRRLGHLSRPRSLRPGGGRAGHRRGRWPRWGSPSRGCRSGWRTPSRTTKGKSVVGQVVYVDRFGTLVTNLTPELVPSYAIARGGGPGGRAAAADLRRRADRRVGGLRGIGWAGRDRRARRLGQPPAGDGCRGKGQGPAGLGPRLSFAMACRGS